MTDRSDRLGDQGVRLHQPHTAWRLCRDNRGPWSPGGGDGWGQHPGQAAFHRRGTRAAIVGDEVVLTRESDDFPAGTAVRCLANGEWRDGTDQDPIISGMLYETWAGDNLGLGVPLLGLVSGGQLVSSWSVKT